MQAEPFSLNPTFVYDPKTKKKQKVSSDEKPEHSTIFFEKKMSRGEKKNTEREIYNTETNDNNNK